MNILQFLESKYVQTNLENQKEFSLWRQAETMSGQNLIHGLRRVYVWLAYFKLTALFLFMKVGLIEEPLPARELQERYIKREAQEKEQNLAVVKNINRTEGQETGPNPAQSLTPTPVA